MCRWLVDAETKIHYVRLQAVGDSGLTEGERRALASESLVVPSEWYSTVGRIWEDLAALLSEIAAAPEWKSTMDEISGEIAWDWVAQSRIRRDESSPGAQ